MVPDWLPHSIEELRGEGLHTLGQASEDLSDRIPCQGYFFQFNSLDAQILVPGEINCLLHQYREDSAFVY